MSPPLPEIAPPEHEQVLLAPPPGSTPPPPPPPVKPKTRRKTWPYLLAALVLAALAYFWFRSDHKQPAAQAKTKSGKAGGRGAGGPTPVVAAKATKGDIGVYVTGL